MTSEISSLPFTARLASVQKKLAEIEAAGARELEKPIDRRDHNILLMLEQQRQKYTLAAELLADFSTGSGNGNSYRPIGSCRPDTTVVSAESSEKPLRIVILGGIGDALLVTPVLRALGQMNPKRRIVIWGDPVHESIFRHNPNVSKFRRLRHIQAFLFNAVGAARWFPYVATDYGCFMPTVIYGTSAVGLLSELFNVPLQNERPELFLTEGENAKASELLRPLKRPLVAIHVRAQCSENKNWSLEYWKELVASFPDITFVQIGKREPLVDGARDYTGTPLRDAFAIMKHCDAFIGVDSVFAHATVAFGTRGIVLFGPSSPGVWGHASNINLYSQRYCSPCLDLLRASPCPFGKACMNEISVASVQAALRRILQQRSETPSPEVVLSL